MTINYKKCLKCPNLFIKNKTRKYCDVHLYKETCKHCNEIFSIKFHNTKPKFCSRKCYWDFRRNNPDIIIQSNQIKQLHKKECIYCKKEFTYFKYRDGSVAFCSVECHKLHRHEFKKCPTCKNIFNSPIHRMKAYCSLSCAAKGSGKRKSWLFNSMYSRLIKDFNIIQTEQLIKGNNRIVFPDFTINENIIIECYGDYWHCNPKKYSGEYFHTKIRKTAQEIWIYDNDRISFLTELGYKCIIIWETDWKQSENLTYERLKYEICKS